MPEILEVADLYKESKLLGTDKLFFPFVFGQSLVKPIVDDKQIEAFYDFNKLLASTDVLVILGYNINEDDNHVNSYLHTFINSGGKILFVGNNDNESEVIEELYRKLKTTNKSSISYLKVVYGNNADVVDKIFSCVESM